MSAGARNDPLTSYNFLVEVSNFNVIIGGFTEVSGLEANTEFEEYDEGGVNNFSHKLPKITKYPNLILKKGVIDSNVLYNWHREVVGGYINENDDKKRRDIAIILLNIHKDEVRRWTFEYAFPVKWSLSDLNSTGDSIMVETLEIAHKGLSVVI